MQVLLLLQTRNRNAQQHQNTDINGEESAETRFSRVG